MPKLIAYSLAVAMLAATPLHASAAVESASSSRTELCSPGGPEGYQRPGGFCDRLDNPNSLSSPITSAGCPNLIADAGYRYDSQLGTLVLNLAAADPCNKVECVTLNLKHLPGEGILVAGAPCVD